MTDDDELLRRLLATPDERDPGFTWRVLTALPARQPRRRFRLVLLSAAALVGALLFFFLLGGAAALTGALLPTGVVLLALAATLLALVSEASDG